MNIFICWRVEDLPVPAKIESIRGRYCVKCGKEIWVMPENAKLKPTFYCRPCGKMLVKEQSKKELVVILPAQAAHVLSENDLQKLEENLKKAMRCRLDN